MMSEHGQRRNGSKSGARIVVVAPERDRLYTEALVQILPPALPEVLDDALPLAGFERAIRSCVRVRPSVVVAILHRSTSKDVIRFADNLRRACPEARLVVIADDDEDIVRGVEAGALAVIPPSGGLEALTDAIHLAADGKMQLDAEKLQGAMRVAARRRLTRAEVSQRLERLTEREGDVLRLVAEGARNKDIALALHISVRTVDTHVTNMLRKLDVHSKLEAAALLQKALVARDAAVRDSA
jgi:NarL family two-component system response regulator LiaR